MEKVLYTYGSSLLANVFAVFYWPYCECNLAAGSCKLELCYGISVNTCRTTYLLEEHSILPPLLLQYINL